MTTQATRTTTTTRNKRPSGGPTGSRGFKVMASMGKGSFDRPRKQILHWVQRLERVNASLDLESAPEVAGNGMQAGRGKPSSSTTANLVLVDSDELCFKSAQLITELLLILFAACLLIIAAIVVFSKKIPAIMESYDVIPKGLFFMCIIVAVCSFFRWLACKIHSRFLPRGQGKEKNEDNNKVGGSSEKERVFDLPKEKAEADELALKGAEGNLAPSARSQKRHENEEVSRLLVEEEIEEKLPSALERKCQTQNHHQHQPLKSYLLIKNLESTTSNNIIQEESSS